MFVLDHGAIVPPMDIGKTLRCYTVEPLRDPVPGRRHTAEPPAAPSPGPVHAQLAEPTSVISPSLVRRPAG